MNILHILDERWDSGLTQYGLTAALGLEEKGHQVYVAAKKGTAAYQMALSQGLTLWPLTGFGSLSKQMRCHEVQIINCHTGYGHFLSRWLVRDGMGLVRTRGDARSVKKSWGHKILYARTDAVICASECIAAQYRDVFPVLADRLWTVYPGLEILPFVQESAQDVRVAVVGRLDPVKGHSSFLESINCIKDNLKSEKFLIVGEEKNTTKQQLQQIMDKLMISPMIEFHGWQEDIGALMRSCHVGVISSVGSEAVSRVALEWMSCGRPVVSTAVGCLPEMVKDGENGFLVPPGDPVSMGKKILELIQNADRRRAMGRRAYEMALENYSLDRFTSATENVYQKVLDQRVQRTIA